MRVLSPRIEPPETLELGSTASTATRWPAPISCRPSVSMKVDLPTPGTPETPIRNAARAGAGSAVRKASARSRWSARLDSSSVIALATARRCALAGRGEHLVEQSLVGGRQHRDAPAFSAGRGERALDLLEHVLRARRDRRSRAVDALDAGVVEKVVVAARDHAADEDDDVVGALRLQRLDHRRHQRLVAGGERRDADRVDVVLDRLARALLGGLEQRADVDVEAEIGEGAGDDLGAAVVAVLAELGDHHARPAPLGVGERGDLALRAAPSLRALS